MKYIVETDSMSMLKQITNKIKDEHQITFDNFISTDYELENNFNEAIGNYLSDNFLGEKKLILLKNSLFLNEKKLNNHLKTILETTINSNTENIIIFQVSKIKNTNSYFAKVKTNFNFIKPVVPKGKEVSLFIKDFLTKNKLNYQPAIIKEINVRVGDNFDLLVNELNKLKLINENLSLDLIENNIFDKKGESIFVLIEAIFKKNFMRLDNSLEKLRIQGYSAIQILEYLINDLIILIQIKLHYQNNEAKFSKNREILAKEMSINSFRILKTQENARLWSFEKLLLFLEKMIDLEMQLMIHNADNQLFILKTSLELFLTSLV